jgi:hypothetical protein
MAAISRQKQHPILTHGAVLAVLRASEMHLTAKSGKSAKGGGNVNSNVILIKERRHQAHGQ